MTRTSLRTARQYYLYVIKLSLPHLEGCTPGVGGGERDSRITVGSFLQVPHGELLTSINQTDNESTNRSTNQTSK